MSLTPATGAPTVVVEEIFANLMYAVPRVIYVKVV